ncbi:hypothetical protein D3C84_938200 [compost metagenome]
MNSPLGLHAADLLNLHTGNRLAVGNDSQCLQRCLGQGCAGGRISKAFEVRRMIRERSQTVVPGDLHYLQAAFLGHIILFEFFKRFAGNIRPLLRNLGDLADRQSLIPR